MRILILLFFFLSGSAGLIYEVVWTKLLTLVIGSTTYSMTTVLVAFMGGLALGSYIGGRIIDKRGDPLLLYGILEGLVGLYCLAVPFLIESTEPLFAYFYNRYYTDQFYVFSMARFFISAAILLVPTTMMGATLPILSKYFVSRKERFGWDVGRLYAINTLGAMFGSFASGFLLLPALGKWLTIVSAAIANIVICVLVVGYWFAVGRRSRSPEVDDTVETGAEAEVDASGATADVEGRGDFVVSRAVVWAVLLAYAANGFAGMSYQIAWTRALSLSLGSSTYSFSVVLTVFIFGLAVGSGVGARLVDRLKNPVRVFGWVEVLIGFAAIGVIYGLGRLPLWIVPAVVRYQSSYDTLLAVQFGIVFALIFVPTFLMGMAFPLAVKVVGMGRSGVGRPVGLAYGWNTAGAIGGSFAAGFILIPLVGLQRTIGAANVVNWVVGALLLGLSWTTVMRRREWWRWALAVAPVVAGVAITIVMPRWDKIIMDSGPFVYAADYMDLLEERKLSINQGIRRNKILFHREGVDTTVSVLESSYDSSRLLRLNGKTDASTSGDMISQTLVAHVPMLMYRGIPDDVLVIGLASGVTVGSITRYPVKAVDVVEISEAVVEASEYFNDWNYNVLEDPRVRLIVGDGRNHLRLTDRKYDVIISEPPNPWMVGVSNLFTREYFESSREKLKEGGVFCCWLQAYSISVGDFLMVARTFLDVFPNASLWESIPAADYILIGSRGPLRADYGDILKKMNNPKVKEDLDRIEVPGPANFIARFLMNSAVFGEISEGEELHVDNRLQLEYNTPKALKRVTYQEFYKAVLRYGQDPAGAITWSGDESLPADFLEKLSSLLQARKLVHQAHQYGATGRFEDARILFTRAFELNPLGPRTEVELFKLLKEMGKGLTELGKYDRALEIYEQVIELRDDYSIIHDRIGAVYLAMERNDEARAAFERAHRKNPRDVIAQFNLGYIDLLEEDYAGAQQWFEKALAIQPDYPDLLNGIGVLAAGLQRLDEAEEYFERAVELDPEFAEAHSNLGFALLQSDKRRKEGIAHLKRALELDPEHSQRERIVEALKRAGEYP